MRSSCCNWLKLPVLVALVALAVASPGRAAEKPILVHYMPWYLAKPYSEVWGWHWTMNRFSPDTTNSAGRPDIASHYTPLIGAYDSADPAVLEYHVLLMKLAGIDGVIADWYGGEDFNDYALIDQRTQALLGFARRAGLKFALCYEDRTIDAQIKAGRLDATNAVAQAQQTMLHAQTHYFRDSAYWRDANGRPVLLNFARVVFKTSEAWEQIFSVLDATNRPAFFSQDLRLDCAQGGYNWPPMHLSRTNAGVLSRAALDEYLTRFEREAAGWPASISSAWPRFHDIYQQAGLGHTYGFLDDAEGATFRSLLTRALTNRSTAVQLVTWNDFGEGTVIEPTVEHGYRDLGAVQELRRQHLQPAFAPRASDLPLAKRLYDLRRQQGSDARAALELNLAFDDIVAGNLKQASARLAALEVVRPALLTTEPSSAAATNAAITMPDRRAAGEVVPKLTQRTP